MKMRTLLTVLIVLLFFGSTPGFSAGPIHNSQQAPKYLSDISGNMSIAVYDEEQVLDGYNLFALRRRNKATNNFDEGTILVTDMKGNVLNSLHSTDPRNRVSDPEMINSTTVFARDSRPFFWNLKTNVTQYFNFTAGTHDMEYNPETQTFLGKYFRDTGNYSGLPIKYNDLYEYDMDGNVLWFWNSSDYFPFNPELADGKTFRGANVWMHANAIFWDYPNDVIYMSARGLDTIYKIDKKTGDVVWGLGRLGNFTLYDINGKKKDSLFYHQHAVELVGTNRMILYDNDYLNYSNPDPEAGRPRIVEIEFNEKTMEAREVWTYTAPEEYFGRPWGDADRLPGGNRLGTFGWVSHDSYLTEVNPAGEVVWEMRINQTKQYAWGMYRSERFYDYFPTEINDVSFDGQMLYVNVSLWDTIKTRAGRDITIRGLLDGEGIFTETVGLNPYFMKTGYTVNFSMSEFSGKFTLEISDGDVTTTINLGDFGSSQTGLPLSPYFIPAIIAIPVLRKRLRKNLR